MLKNSFFRTIFFLFFVVLFISCDKEYNGVGQDIIGDNSFDIAKKEFPVMAYNQKVGPIQSNNLAVNALGILDDSSFGTTKASFVTQLSLAVTNPTFDVSAQVTKVVLTIPYFYNASKTDLNVSDGSSTYVLDSIHGPSNAKMKLSVYESGYAMLDLNSQKYFSNQYADFQSQASKVALNDDVDKSQNLEFFFDKAEHVDSTLVAGTTKTYQKNYSPPGMKLKLNTVFFQDKIIKASKAYLSNNQNFIGYFKGLFFDVESIPGTTSNMAMLDFSKGKITITYTETIATVVTEKTLDINLTGNTVSFLNNSNVKVGYSDALTKADKDKGDANLYLKGGQGSVAVVKLFGEDKFGDDGVSGIPNGCPDELDIMRINKYLINQAELTFYLNSDLMKDSKIPQRIYLYDFTNNKVILDNGDNTNAVNPKNNKYIFGGILFKETDANGGGYYYQFRITDHIRSLVKYADLKNVDLGLVVTENINNSGFYSSSDILGIPPMIPVSSVMNPLGAILYGTKSANVVKPVKFEIYYTKTK